MYSNSITLENGCTVIVSVKNSVFAVGVVDSNFEIMARHIEKNFPSYLGTEDIHALVEVIAGLFQQLKA